MIYLCIVIYITISHVQSDHHQDLVIDAKFAHSKVLEKNIMNNEKVGVVKLGYNHEIFSITSKSSLLILLTLVSLDIENFPY